LLPLSLLQSWTLLGKESQNQRLWRKKRSQRLTTEGGKWCPLSLVSITKSCECFYIYNSVLLFLTSLIWFAWCCREWNFWEARNHWYLSQSLSLSHNCFQLGQYHSHKYHQHLQWQCQFIHLDWGFSLWHLFWPLQDTRILHNCFLSGLNLYFQTTWLQNIWQKYFSKV